MAVLRGAGGIGHAGTLYYFRQKKQEKKKTINFKDE
jgi:hypothetical protein